MANEKGRGNMRNLNETLRQVLPASMFPIVMPCHCGSRVFHTIDELLGFIEVADTADHKGIKQAEYNEMLRDMYVKHALR